MTLDDISIVWGSASKYMQLQEIEKTGEGLKIRRYLVPWGFDSPPGTSQRERPDTMRPNRIFAFPVRKLRSSHPSRNWLRSDHSRLFRSSAIHTGSSISGTIIRQRLDTLWKRWSTCYVVTPMKDSVDTLAEANATQHC